MFSVAYVRQTTNTDSSNCHNFQHHTIKCIAVAKDPLTDGMLFYNPRTNNTISSSDYRIDISKPAGIAFKYSTDDSLHFHLHDHNAEDFTPPTYNNGSIVHIRPNDDPSKPTPAYVLSIPLSPEQPYTVQHIETSTIQ